MQNSFKISSIGGIDIYVNWSWLIVFALLTWSLGTFYHDHFSAWSMSTAYIVAAISAILLFITVLLHELAHSFTARANGLPVSYITLFLFGGVSNLTQEPPSPKVELLVAIAGPITSLVLSGIFYVLHAVSRSGPSEIYAILGYLASVNLLLALFNMIPGFPLDGGRVFRSIVWWITGNMRKATHIASDVGQGIGFLFILAGLFLAFAGGQLISGIWLALIGWFLQNAASSSYQQAVMDSVLRGVDVHDVMDPAPAAAPLTTSVATLVYHHMLSENQRTVPVTGPDARLMGLVTLSDVRETPREQWDTTPVSQIMTPADKLCTVTPGEDLRHALQVLAENNYHQLPVVQNGMLVGILNRGHVLQYVHLREQLGPKAPSAGAIAAGRGYVPPPPDRRAS